MFTGTPCIYQWLQGHPVFTNVYWDTLYLPMATDEATYTCTTAISLSNALYVLTSA